MDDWLSKLEVDRLVAIANLFLTPIYFFSFTSIVFVLLGDYIISYYNLEKKFPKLAFFIQLRQKFRKYYLYTNISWLILAWISQIIFNSIIVFHYHLF